ncbi:histidine triad (HIT) family protein [Algoriphagus ratkowskyi]|uniref:HIT family protein n=1 Tax=Algoriphagus ratkowskyi TaxID=57028 RepID=A0A2W7R3N9_9BACT|nr:HIT family protein [Algoriphagus ratkowskyi]PZX53836.1 histidine triad (HIT) family protein [Algoriphagus ratkowskyi]TXD76759.1 HIT family protein [Algoriphagus ratkowskyi]
MASIFTKIIKREIPAHIVAEDENYLAFLDIMPLVKGHVLVVPKKEVDYIFDLEPEVLSGLHIFAQQVAKAMDKTIKCTRIGVAVIGLEVPHVHIHLVPLRTMDDINFTRPKLKLSNEELAEIAERIRGGF